MESCGSAGGPPATLLATFGMAPTGLVNADDGWLGSWRLSGSVSKSPSWRSWRWWGPSVGKATVADLEVRGFERRLVGIAVVLGPPQADRIVPRLLPLLHAPWCCAADLDVAAAGLLGRCALILLPLDHDGSGPPGMTKTALHRESRPKPESVAGS